MTGVRVVTFNTAGGNPRIKTPQASFLALPFYREAMDGAPDAPILALQEVGPAQLQALQAAARRPGARFTLLELHRPGLGDALVIPDRYQVLGTRRGFYALSHLKGVADGLSRWAGRKEKPDWRQFGELRTWLQARLRDGGSGHELTVFNTHLSVDGSVKAAQAKAIVQRAADAAKNGPVILAGDFNVAAQHATGRDVEIGHVLAAFEDMGTAIPPHRPNIDYVLARGFEPVSSRIWTGDSLQLPGSPNADLVSDHYAEDDVLAFAAA